MSRLNDLIRQVGLKDEALAADLQREVAALADRRSFGLNFERHVPEAVELPGRPVRRGDKVRILPPRGETPKQDDERLWQVRTVSRTESSREAELVALADETEATTASLDDLVVVAEFRDPIYPGLVSTGKVERGGDKPFHTVINAENYHALQALLFTHRGKVDCIYIDPPYNTGNDGWIYNDKYVAADDHYKHSKWLAFMERRLLLAKDLLKPTGVVIVAIGDDEHHRLRMLMDQLLGTQNFISDVVWQGGRKNDSRYVSNGADYMLIYARDEEALSEEGHRWRVPKPLAAEASSHAQRAWIRAMLDTAEEGAIEHSFAPHLESWLDEPGGQSSVPNEASLLAALLAEPATAERVRALAQLDMRRWFRADGRAASSAVSRFDDVDPTDGRLFNADRPIDWPGGGGPRYDVLHPVTGRPCKVPSRGWMYANADRMQAEIDAGHIAFGEDETKIPRGKTYLEESLDEVSMSVFESRRSAGAHHLAKVLNDKRFPNPKDHEILMRWISLVGSRDAVVVDFFGGSGSTVEAVMRLNAEKGGLRHCILVTNNEVSAKDAKALIKAGHRDGDPEWEAKGVHDYVAKPRLTTIVTGERPDGSTYDDTVDANVEFFDLTYEAPLRVASHRDFERIAPLLWLRAGSRGRRIDDVRKGWDVAEVYGVLADLDQVEPFLKAVAAQEDAGEDGISIAFIVTDEDRLFESVVRELPEHVEPVRLYEAYLRNFEIEFGRGLR